MAPSEAYRANVDLGVAGMKIGQHEVFWLPENSAADPGISLLVAARAIERLSERDGEQEPAPIRRKRR